MSQTQQILTFIIVTLTDMMLHGDAVPEGTMLEVEKALRDDWRGCRIARDATEEEIEDYRAEQGAVDVVGDALQDLARKRGDLEDEIYNLGQKKSELTAEIGALSESKQELSVEVEALKAAAAAAKKAAK